MQETITTISNLEIHTARRFAPKRGEAVPVWHSDSWGPVTLHSWITLPLLNRTLVYIAEPENQTWKTGMTQCPRSEAVPTGANSVHTVTAGTVTSPQAHTMPE